VGLLALRACIDGAALNVRINLAGLKDEKLKASLQEKVQRITAESDLEFKKIEQIVETKVG
jgi:formiminotetrahydrofolate cyclodeaminase